MKNILIVDDDAGKAANIEQAVQQAARCAVRIEIVGSLNGAREALGRQLFDLLVLDLAIPIMDDGTADPNGGITLLEEIDKTDSLIRPVFVLGLTAFDNLQDTFREQFASKLWSIELYDAAVGTWRERLAAKVRYLTGHARSVYRSDVAVVTALESPELDSIINKWPAQWQAPEALDETTYIYQGTLGQADSTVSINAAACSRKGMVAATLLSAKLISECGPALVLMPGICAGVRDKVDIGDVLVADPCWNWQDGRLQPTDTLFSPHQLDLEPEIQSRVRLLVRDKDLCKAAFDAFDGVKPDRVPKIVLGPVATGSSVIADKSVVASIALQNRDLIGAEMEIYGVYAAARDAKSPKPFCLSMKSVCDFGEEDKDNKYQKFAAHMSSYVARAFAERFARELRSLR